MWIKVAFQEMAPRSPIDITRPSVQTGDVMYWQSIFNKILAFHVKSRELHEIPVPVDIRWCPRIAALASFTSRYMISS
jgi:hypothetical protein